MENNSLSLLEVNPLGFITLIIAFKSAKNVYFSFPFSTKNLFSQIPEIKTQIQHHQL
jgi:hypothetical protein